jgi:hypothetical protein
MCDKNEHYKNVAFKSNRSIKRMKKIILLLEITSEDVHENLNKKIINLDEKQKKS